MENINKTFQHAKFFAEISKRSEKNLSERISLLRRGREFFRFSKLKHERIRFNQG